MKKLKKREWMGRKYHKLIKKVVVQANIFFKTLISLDLKKDTLKVCSQKFVKTIDKDKPICYNKAKLRDRNEKIKKLKMNIKNRQNKEKTNELDKKHNKNNLL